MSGCARVHARIRGVFLSCLLHTRVPANMRNQTVSRPRCFPGVLKPSRVCASFWFLSQFIFVAGVFCQCTAIYRESSPPSGLSNCFGLRLVRWRALTRRHTHTHTLSHTDERTWMQTVLIALVSYLNAK